MAELTQADFDNLRKSKDREINTIKLELDDMRRRHSSLEEQLERVVLTADEGSEQPKGMKGLLAAVNQDKAERVRLEAEARSRAQELALKRYQIADKYSIKPSELQGFDSPEAMLEYCLEQKQAGNEDTMPKPPSTPSQPGNTGTPEKVAPLDALRSLVEATKGKQSNVVFQTQSFD